MNKPPTLTELVTYAKGLDERYVIKHFLGKTQSDARRMYPTGGTSLAEDFTYMASDGLRYYLPPALDYLRDDQSTHDWDFCHGLMCSLFCRARRSHDLATDVLVLIKEIAKYCDTHRDKFGIDVTEDLFDEYVRTIHAA